MKDFKFPKNNLPWLEPNTFFITLHGSHAYGTNTETSDIDVRGLCVPPAKYFHGYLEHFEQFLLHSIEQDFVDFSLVKFMEMAAKCNPNALEIIFTDPRHHLLVSPLGDRLLDARELFISKKAKHTFSGYAVAQLGRIKRHRGWLLNPPTHKPTRVEFGLPEHTVIPADQLAAVWSQVRAKIEEWDVDYGSLVDDSTKIDIQTRIAKAMAEQFITSDNQWMSAARVLGVTENFLHLMDKEKRYKTALTEWIQYNTWKTERNPARAALEARFGYDTKHGMHLVRLLRMGKEILDGKGLIVFRPDREELMEIRRGLWSFEKLAEWAEQAEAELDVSLAKSTLPWGPDYKKLDKLCVEIVEESLTRSSGEV